jgi:uncharacterized protein (DUF2062 family)
VHPVRITYRIQYDCKMLQSAFQRKLRLIYLRLIRLRGHPHEVALGMALGIFIGMTPIIPFHMVTAVALALFFKANKITAAGGTWICNPVTVYPIYKYCYKIGTFILGFDHHMKLLLPVAKAIDRGEFFEAFTTILSGGGMAVAAFFLGGVMLGVIFAVPSYFLFYYFIKGFVSWRGPKRLAGA